MTGRRRKLIQLAPGIDQYMVRESDVHINYDPDHEPSPPDDEGKERNLHEPLPFELPSPEEIQAKAQAVDGHTCTLRNVCQLGCVCESINNCSNQDRYEKHCRDTGHPECLFGCICDTQPPGEKQSGWNASRQKYKRLRWKEEDETCGFIPPGGLKDESRPKRACQAPERFRHDFDLDKAMRKRRALDLQNSNGGLTNGRSSGRLKIKRKKTRQSKVIASSSSTTPATTSSSSGSGDDEEEEEKVETPITRSSPAKRARVVIKTEETLDNNVQGIPNGDSHPHELPIRDPKGIIALAVQKMGRPVERPPARAKKAISAISRSASARGPVNMPKLTRSDQSTDSAPKVPKAKPVRNGVRVSNLDFQPKKELPGKEKVGAKKVSSKETKVSSSKEIVGAKKNISTKETPSAKKISSTKEAAGTKKVTKERVRTKRVRSTREPVETKAKISRKVRSSSETKKTVPDPDPETPKSSEQTKRKRVRVRKQRSRNPTVPVPSSRTDENCNMEQTPTPTQKKFVISTGDLHILCGVNGEPESEDESPVPTAEQLKERLKANNVDVIERIVVPVSLDSYSDLKSPEPNQNHSAISIIPTKPTLMNKNDNDVMDVHRSSSEIKPRAHRQQGISRSVVKTVSFEQPLSLFHALDNGEPIYIIQKDMKILLFFMYTDKIEMVNIPVLEHISVRSENNPPGPQNQNEVNCLVPFISYRKSEAQKENKESLIFYNILPKHFDNDILMFPELRCLLAPEDLISKLLELSDSSNKRAVILKISELNRNQLDTSDIFMFLYKSEIILFGMSSPISEKIQEQDPSPSVFHS